MLNRGQLIIENVELLTKANVLLDEIHLLGDFPAVDDSFAACRPHHSGKHINKRCLACTVVTQNSEDLSHLN